jgi:ABC-type iron transport system FetAB permease component
MIWKRRLWEARQLNRRVFAAINRAKDSPEKKRILEILDTQETIMVDVATQVDVIVAAANAAIQAAPVIPVGGAIIGANAVNLIQAQAGLTNTAQIPANQIQQPPATPPPAS